MPVWPNKAGRLQADSLPDLVREWQLRTHTLIVRHDLQLAGGDTCTGHCLNALVVDFLAQPDADQPKILARALARFEEYLKASHGTPSGNPEPDPAPNPIRAAGAQQLDDRDAAAGTGRKKGRKLGPA